MKKYILILVMLLTATTAFNQTSRRTANNNTRTAGNSDNKKAINQVNRTSNTIDRSTRTRTTYTVSQKQNENRAGISARRTTISNNSANRNTTSYATRQNNQTGRNNYVSEYGRRMNPGQAERKENTSTVRNTNNTTRIVTRTTNNYYPSQRKFYGQHVIRHYYTTLPQNRIYRAKYFPYRAPVRVNIVWTSRMRNIYINMYPSVVYRHYSVGYRIETISAYDAIYSTGEIKNVYGKVFDTYYESKTDEYFLYFGAYYPYHDFTVVIPGRVARKFSRRPELYFENQHLMVTGLITSYDNRPEVVVHRDFQIKLY